VTGFGLLAALGLLLLSSLAWAQGPQNAPNVDTSEEAGPFASALRVEVISCVLEESAVDVSEMLKIARAELAPHVLVRADEKNSQPLLRVDACHDERLVLRLLSPEGPEQSVALHDVPPEHRPRVAALALAELVLTARAVGEWRAERAAMGENPSDKPSAGQPRAPTPVQSGSSARLPDWNAAAAPAQSRLRLGLGAEARLFIESMTFSFGPRLFLRLARVDLALLGLIGRRDHPLGELYTVVLAFNTAVHLWRATGPVEAAVSLGAEVGASLGRGEPDTLLYGEPTKEWALFGSGFAELTIGGAITDQASMHARLAAGYAWGVRAERANVGATGGFIGLSAGIAWLL
jgi:hypothetical protein